MANTYPKLPLRVIVPSSSFLSLIERDWPEADSQTFPVGAPLKNSSGKAAVWVNSGDADILGISLTAGQNTTSATTPTKIVPLTAEIELEANFLGGSAADNVLAAGDLFLTRDLIASSTLLPKAPRAGWYFEDAANDAVIQIIEFKSDFIPPNSVATAPAAGDTNARVRGRVIEGKSDWY